jgi:hypothetical protein
MSLFVCKKLFVYSFMKMTKDPYSILGIPPGSTETDIKKAYKDLIRQHHPDKGGSEEKCKEINQAYNQLMNPEETGMNIGMNTGMNMGIDPGIFEFLNMFNQMRKGPTIRTSIVLTLEQIEKGGIYTINYTKKVLTGNVINQVISTPLGEMLVSVPEEKTMTHSARVEIPSCVNEKLPLVYPEFIKGQETGPNSDLELTVVIEKHPVYTRKSIHDLTTEFEISLKESLVGFERELLLLGTNVPTKIICNSVVNYYEPKIIKGLGMNGVGDLYINFKVIFPTSISPETVILLKESL